MAVQKSRKTRAKRDMRRMHDKMQVATLSADESSGEVHRRHHLTETGHYRGRQFTVVKDTRGDDGSDDNEKDDT